jgi:hypothetical protein
MFGNSASANDSRMGPSGCDVLLSVRWPVTAPGRQHCIRLKSLANGNRDAIDPQIPVLTTFKSLVDHYRLTELKMDTHVRKAYSTKRRTESYLEKWIVPRWGEYRPGDIKSVAVEEWLDALVHDYRKEDKGEPLAEARR